MQENEIEELIVNSKDNNEAMEQLLQYFKPKVIAISREYFLVGAESSDLIQEGMIGLYKAINIYNKEKNHSFSAFASLCIHRQLQNAVKNANRKKNSPLNSYLPIKYYDGSCDDESLTNLVIVDDSSDIEKNYIDKEMNAIMISKVKNLLTENEFQVLKLFLNGEKYTDIALRLNATTKKIDNMLQIIKKKLKTIKGDE